MRTILLAFEPDTLSQEQIEQVERAAPDWRVMVTREREAIVEALDEIEIAAGGFPRDLLAEARNLRWLQQWGAGADWLLRQPEAAAQDFVLTNASGIHAIPISEHILALMLAFARGLHKAMGSQADREWASPGRENVFELAGRTMLLVGVGAIGERTARLASALEMRVLGVRRHPEQGVDGVDEMAGPEHLDALLPRADIVVLTVPLTEETRGMIGEAQLRAMRQGAILINIGRGGTVDEAALARALGEGWIGGAGLDVFEEEPLPADSPLWGLDNVIITAHYSGSTPHYNERALAIFLDNLERYQAGVPLHNVVDKAAGY